MESLTGEFRNIGKFPVLHSPDKSEDNYQAIWAKSESFHGEPLLGEFSLKVWQRGKRKNTLVPKVWGIVIVSIGH